MLHFNEDTRVKFPATIQFLRLGYNYQSLKNAQIDFNTKIFIDRFKGAIEKINGITLSNEELFALIDEIHTLMKYNDLGKFILTEGQMIILPQKFNTYVVKESDTLSDILKNTNMTLEELVTENFNNLFKVGTVIYIK